MAKVFTAKPLFDAHLSFTRLPSGLNMLRDYPDALAFIKQQSEKIPDVFADFNHTQAFLKSYSRKNEATYRSYRNEVERLLLWSWTVACKSIVQLRRADLENFFDFVNHPPDHWISTAVHDRFKMRGGSLCCNPLWRPFVTKIAKRDRALALADGKDVIMGRQAHRLSNSAMKICFSALSCFYNYLTDESYAFGNPIPAIRKQSPYLLVGASQKEIRRLSDMQWQFVLETAQGAANRDPSMERSLFMIALLKTLYLRISELSERPNWQPSWQHFWSDNEGNQWLKVLGKGNKIRDVSVPDALLPYIQRYRNYRSSESFSFGANSPLVVKNRGIGGMTSRQLRRIVQATFDAAYKHMVEEGFGDQAETLQAASSHWLRHTGASQDIATRPLKHMADDLGHASMATTDQVYIQSDMKERAYSGKDRDV
ncbi:MAG: tyrosine-type recombinase/integrase [Porticoccaceae bacterium]|nr:tyrosine-type recombinase/integrase [Porticoccaceae bacterium]